MKKVVLAFSGGLDTSFCAKHLSRDKGYEVVAVSVNTGGFSKQDALDLESRAKGLGVSEFHFIDETENFYQEGVKYLLFGNVLKNNTYPLSVSAERVFQAVAIANKAVELEAHAIAHGSTGAGNDQIRFDMIFESLCPGMEIITPIRDLSLSRKQEIEYLVESGVNFDWEKAKYSINKGLWGTSVGGKETLTSDEYLPEEAFPSSLKREKPVAIDIGFDSGEPCSLDGKSLSPVNLILELTKICEEYAIGRDIHVGDTIVGIKGRVGFEAGAPLILIKAHHSLEKHVLTKNQLFIKDQLSQFYGQMMHEGQYLDPAMRDMEAYLNKSQENVTGTVQVYLAPYRFHVQGIHSQFDLMHSKFGTYGEENNMWTGDDARGFAKIWANQTKLINSIK